MVPPITILSELRHSGNPLCHQAADALERSQANFVAEVIHTVDLEHRLAVHQGRIDAALLAISDTRHHTDDPHVVELLAVIERALTT